MLGYIFIFLAFAAVVSLVYYQKINNNISNLQILDSQTGVKVYTNKAYGFEIQYPVNYILATNYQDKFEIGLDPYGFEANANLIASIDLPQSLYPNSNFVEAYVFIDAAKNITEAKCKTFTIKVQKLSKPHDEIINSLTYYTIDYMARKAGNYYESKTYRIMHNNICYEINLNFHTANFGKSPNVTITQVNDKDVWNKLGNMLKIFKYVY